jgi:hypothetical protein
VACDVDFIVLQRLAAGCVCAADRIINVAIVYSTAAITARLSGVITAIDAGPGNGVMLLLNGGVTLATITLAKPCGVAAAGVLTFTVPATDIAADATGNADGARIQDSTGAVMISGLTVGIPLSGANVTIANGLNSTLVTVGQVVTLISGQIIGS